jgi:hypothetical protein
MEKKGMVHFYILPESARVYNNYSILGLFALQTGELSRQKGAIYMIYIVSFTLSKMQNNPVVL